MGGACSMQGGSGGILTTLQTLNLKQREKLGGQAVNGRPLPNLILKD